MEVNEQNYFEVDFKKHCKTCKHKDKTGDEFPCTECLEAPTNLHSQKPFRYEEKTSR